MAPAPPHGRRERRRAPRYKVSFSAGLNGDAGPREGTVTDLSTLGCFVLGETAGARPGDLIMIELRLRAGAGISVWGSVVYVTEGIGFAVQFSVFDTEEDRKRLGWLVNAEARRAAAEGAADFTLLSPE